MKNKFVKSIALIFVCLALVLVGTSLAGCNKKGNKNDNKQNSEPGEAQVKSISLNNDILVLVEGQSETLVATVDPENTPITWTSSDSTKVEVDENGKVTAIEITDTTVIVTASAGDKSATCTVTVVESDEDITYEETASVSFKADDLIDGLNMNAGDRFNQETALVEGVIYITANSEKTCPKISDKSTDGYKFGEDDGRYYHSINTQGEGKKDYRSIKLVLDRAAKIVVYCRNSYSDDKNELANGLNVGFYDGSYLQIGDYKTIVGKIGDASAEKAELTFTTNQSGEYYIGTEAGGLDIYAIFIYYAK